MDKAKQFFKDYFPLRCSGFNFVLVWHICFVEKTNQEGSPMDGNGQLESAIDQYNNQLIQELIGNLQETIRGVFYLKIILVLVLAMFILSFFIWPELRIVLLTLLFLFVLLWSIMMFGFRRDKKFNIQDLRTYLLKDHRFRNSVSSFRNHELIRKYIPELA